MATTTSLPPSGSSPTGPLSPPSSPTVQGSGNIPPLSLSLYIFSVTLSLFLVIVGALVARSVRRRRRRIAAVSAALGASGYGPSSAFRGKHDDLWQKPMLWETHITPVDDGGKGWAGIMPVAGATLVPITKISTDDVKSQRPSFGRLRLPTFGDRRPTASDLLQTTPSLERPASPSEPLHLTVLISMPTPHAGKAGQDNKNNNGPSAVAVELGIAQVAYTPNVT